MSKSLSGKFFGSSARGITNSAINILATILVVRWFGTESYANFIIDLSVIGILMIVLEAIPSNYSLFRIQDDDLWKYVVAAQAVVTAIVAGLVVALVGLLSSRMQDFSPWMVVYSGALSIKRYFDIRLQSSGRLNEYMNIDLVASFLRVLIMGLCFALNFLPVTSIWAPLAVSCLLSLAYWVIRDGRELSIISNSFGKSTMLLAVGGFGSYKPYYLGIALKRVKDNLMPIMAERVFYSTDALAAFFIAYRGVVFACGQMRIVEAMMNHRETLRSAMSVTWKKRVMVLMIGQVLCVSASFLVLLASGVNESVWMVVLILSFIVWPYGFLIVERSKAYSSFKAGYVNWSMCAYVVSLVAGSSLMVQLNNEDIRVFASTLLLSEIVACLAIVFLRMGRRPL